MKYRALFLAVMVLYLAALFPLGAQAAQSDEELAKKALNPVAAMISLPLQFNQDYGIGPDDNATRTTLNIQPVIPMSVSKDMNLIIRTIVPVIWAESPVEGGSNASGMGDITQSFFVSPKETVGGWILGFGPVLLYPTAALNTLGSQKWGAGPTGVLLRQEKGFTYGLLFNHIWSYTGNDDRDNIKASFLQPFFSYTTKTFTTLGINTESSYDWKTHDWIVPINVTLTQILKIKNQPLSIQLGYRYYADAPEYGPDWGLRCALTFLFPKG